MTSVDDINAAIDKHDSTRGHRKAKAALDKRMPLGVKLDGEDSHVTVDLVELPRDDSWDAILEKNPYVDPLTHEVDPFRGAEITSWDVSSMVNGVWKTTTNHRCKVPVRLRAPGERLTEAKVAELSKLIRKRKAVEAPTDGSDWLVVCLADLQLGKDNYGGTPATVERVNMSLDKMRKLARTTKPAGICIADLGDICEQVSCFYDSQTYSIDLNLTEQIELAIEIVMAAIDGVLEYAPRIIFGAVPSNHGEFRVGKGQVSTDRARDNVDLVIANSIARIMSANVERYGHVEVWTPPTEGGDPYVLTLDLDGVMVGFTHGHQVASQGNGRMGKLEQWWKNHQWSDRKRIEGEDLPTAADCDILVTGHGHTFMASEQTGKLLIQCPAAESGSEYFTTSSGKRSSAGVLSFMVSDRWPMLANHWDVL